MNKGDHRALTLSIPLFDSGKHILAIGTTENRVISCLLGPLDSTYFERNTEGWESELPNPIPISNLQIFARLDGSLSNPLTIHSGNPVSLELEFRLAPPPA